MSGRLTLVPQPAHPLTDPRDPLGLRADAPLLDGWLASTDAADRGALTPMCTPGHKQRQDLTGAVVAGDTPLYGGVDTIKHADMLLADAEAPGRAAVGSGLVPVLRGRLDPRQPGAGAGGRLPGQEVIVTRCLHRSLLLGLVLAGLRPVWVLPERDPGTGLPGAVAVQTVRSALAAHPGACAVFLGDPSYVGTTGDLAGHADAAHEAGVPLIVDAAWAAYLGFHPDLPPHAIAAGADGMVTSAHKALPAATQGALVFARTGLLDRARLDRAFEATHTTSPAGAITREHRRGAGTAGQGRQAAVRPPAAPGGHRQAAAGRGARRGRARRARRGPGQAGRAARRCRGRRLRGGGRSDRRRDAGGAGRPGHDHPDRHGRGHRGHGGPVLRGAGGLDRAPPRPGPASRAVPAWSVVPQMAIPPREAFFSPNETVAADAAVGRISAELVAPYPPGIPVLAPGEVITGEAWRRCAPPGRRAAGSPTPPILRWPPSR